jgi:cytochrome c-type biogenesis protein CcmH/NrfF
MKAGFILLMAMVATPALSQGSGPIPELANQQLADPKREAEATRLMHGLRCIQCQGQSIADSDAPMAATTNRTRQKPGEYSPMDDWPLWRMGKL